MTPATQERLAQLWLAEYEPVRSRVRRQIESFELAEDITMQAFTKLGAKLDRLTVREPAALLRRIADDLVIDHYRAEDKKPTLVPLIEDSEDDAEGVGVYQPYIDPDFTAGFDLAVRDLPEPERDVFILTELRGLSQEDTAEVLRVSQPTVSRRHRAALTTIREELAA